jgi:hypothetical protein
MVGDENIIIVIIIIIVITAVIGADLRFLSNDNSLQTKKNWSQSKLFDQMGSGSSPKTRAVKGRNPG